MSNFDAFADFRMDGHVAIVTGGAQNIGEAIAKTFSGAGAKVMIADLDGEKAQATAEAIQAVTGNQVLGTHIPHPQLSQIKKAIKVVHTN